MDSALSRVTKIESYSLTDMGLRSNRMNAGDFLPHIDIMQFVPPEGMRNFSVTIMNWFHLNISYICPGRFISLVDIMDKWIAMLRILPDLYKLFLILKLSPYFRTWKHLILVKISKNIFLSDKTVHDEHTTQFSFSPQIIIIMYY